MDSKSTIRWAGLALFATAVLFAQRDLGTILGTITDAQNAVIAGARVTITEDATGLKYVVESSPAGEYIRPLLKPGTYSVEAEAPGFRKTIQRGVILTSGDRIAVNMQLSIGDVTQSVEITAAAPALQTESTIIGHTMNARSISELPLGGQR